MRRKAIPIPTVEILRQKFDFDRATGEIRKKKGKRAGLLVGHLHSSGYHTVWLQGRHFLAHRIAWVMVHGSLSEDLLVDHINGIRNDNSIANLRLATNTQNSQNKLVSGVRYVEKARKWQARIRRNGTSIHIGMFPTEDEATVAYLAVGKVLSGEFFRST